MSINPIFTEITINESPPPEEPTCRYCLSSDPVDNLIKPCKCSGSVAHIHKNCLKTFLNSKNNRIVLPFRNFAYTCELCHTNYKIKFAEQNFQRNMWLISKYIFMITVLLFASYFLLGAFLQVFKQALFHDFGSQLRNIFGNGFIFTHLLIGLIFIVLAILNSNGIICYFGGNDGDCGEAAIIIIIIIGILCSVLVIYLEILARLEQREKNKKEIIDIENY